MGYGSMQGIPMVASSPVRHESPIGISPIEVQSYTAPWKALSDFALHQDLDRLDMSTPHFQQIVNQTPNTKEWSCPLTDLLKGGGGSFVAFPREAVPKSSDANPRLL
ncbi:Insulin protein enhancer protein isl-1 [Sarracenia purpurea var. burkii]